LLPINDTLMNIYHEATVTLAKNLGHDLDHDLFMKKNIIFRIHHFKSSICSIEINQLMTTIHRNQPINDYNSQKSTISGYNSTVSSIYSEDSTIHARRFSPCWRWCRAGWWLGRAISTSDASCCVASVPRFEVQDPEIDGWCPQWSL